MQKRIALAESLHLPLALITESTAILAVRRAGKSHTAKRIVEQVLRADQQVVVVDPKGDWWGLRTSADGRSPGFPVVVLGGEHGDVPLEAGAGELVAKLVVEERVSIVLDLSSFRKYQIPVFMTPFLETLYRLKARDQYRTPVLVVLEEGDVVAPQRPQRGEERMLGAAEDLVRRGGQRGIGVLLVSQRAAVLNKNVLTQCGVLVLLRTTGSQDIDAVDTWIEKHGQDVERARVLEALPSLPTGEAFVWAPGWPTERGTFERVKVLACETFDSGATPKPGQAVKPPKTAAEVDLNAFRERMAETIERAKAEDPKEARKALAESEKQLAAARREIDRLTRERQTVAAKAKPPKVVIAGATPAELDRLEAIGVRLVEAYARDGAVAKQVLDEALRNVTETAETLKRITGTIRERQSSVPTGKVADFAPVLRDAGLRPAVEPEPKALTYAPTTSPAVTPRSTSGRIELALVQCEALGMYKVERSVVALLSGYRHPRSKGFLNALGAAHTEGRIVYDLGKVSLAPNVVGPVLAPMSVRHYQELLLAALDHKSAEILRALIEATAPTMSREALARHVGYAHPRSKGFLNALGRLSGLKLVSYPGAGSVALVRANLFPGEEE